MTLKTDEQENGLSFKDNTSQTGYSGQPSADTASADTYNSQPAFDPEVDDTYKYTSTSSIKKDISFKEFYKDYCSSEVKKNITGSAVALYVCCGITFLAAIAASVLGVDIMAGIIDAILILGLALGIQIGKSRACAVIILVYSIINCIYSLVSTGKLGGYLIIIAAVYATIYTFKARKEYNEYING